MRRYFFVLAVLSAGCATANNPMMNDNQEAYSVSGLVLDAVAEPLLLKRGETLHITATVTNETNAPVVKGFASGCIYGFALRNIGGELVAPPPPICTQNAPTVRYAPGEVVTLEFRWAWDDPDIEPGVYFVVAGFGERGEGELAPPVEVRLQ